MDVATALKRVKRQFGDEYNIIFNDDDVFGWIYEAELDIVRTTGCNDVTLTNTIAAYPLAIPDRVEIKRVSIDGRALRGTSKEELDLLATSELTEGSASYWYMETNQLHLWPVQTTATSTAVKLLYTKVPTLIVEPLGVQTFTVPDVYRSDVVRYCISRAHNKNRNYNAEKIELETYNGNLGRRSAETQTQDQAIYKLDDPEDYDEFAWR